MAWRWVGVSWVVATLIACSGSSSNVANPDGGAGSSGASGGAAGSSGSSGSGSGGAAGSGGSVGSGGSGGSVGSGGSGGSVAGACPASPPMSGRDCPLAVSSNGCSYGDSILPECRDQWECQCVSAQPGVTCSWIPGNPWMACGADAAACPSTTPVSAPDGGLASCAGASEGTRCSYADGTICNCTSCLDLGGPCQPVNPPRWRCSPAPANPQCPRKIPNNGTACTQPGLECVYASSCGIQARCESNRWTWTRQQCPQ